MAYVPIPKDLTKVRQKLILNLTKRQVICFSGGALIGVPLFFLTKNALPGSMATFLMRCWHSLRAVRKRASRPRESPFRWAAT